MMKIFNSYQLMRHAMKIVVATFGVLVVLGMAGSAHAVTVYSEDFEAVTVPTTLQDAALAGGAWTEEPTPDGGNDIAVTNTSTGFPSSQAIDGESFSGGHWWDVREVPKPTNGQVYTVTADIYAQSTGDPTVASGFGLVDSTHTLQYYENPFHGIHFMMGGPGAEGWRLAAHEIGTGGGFGFENLLSGSDGYDEVVQVSFILDFTLATPTYTGSITWSGGTASVTRPMTSQLDIDRALALDRLTIDHAVGGYDMDNILITDGDDVPEPPAVTDFTWSADGVGDWLTSGNWTPMGGPPSGPNDTVTFADSITGPTTVVTNVPVTVNRIEFMNTTHSYAVGGLGSVNLAATTAPAPVNPRIDVVGTHQFQAIVNLENNTTVNVSSASTLAFNNTLDLMSNTLTKTGDGTLAIRNDLVTGGGTVNLQQGTITGNGTIGGDLNNVGGTVSPGNSPDGVSAIPEPGTLILGLAGLLSLSLRRRRT